MTQAEFTALVGPQLLHITAAANAAGIAVTGLQSAAELAAQAGGPAQIALRTDRHVLTGPFGTATLNHQRPLLAGRRRAAAFLDGHTLASWAQVLDRRIFFWPAKRGAAFARSLGGACHVLRLDAARLFARFAAFLDLSPLNSGNAARRAAVRGDWLFVPATAPRAAFTQNRRRRGLVRGADTVTEVSLRCSLPAADLRAVLA